MRRAGLVGAALLAALACKPEAARKQEAARAAVQRFFEALPTGDCAVLAPLLVEEGSAGSCRETVDELNAHGFALVEVLGAQVDGRSPDAVVVRARVARDGRVREQPFLLRVERHPGGWKLRL